MKKLICIAIFTMLCIPLYIYIEEVNYTQIETSNHIIIISSCGIDEPINNISIDNGVYQEGPAYFGHRTSHGSPFYNLDKIKVGETYQICDVTYRVTDVKIVLSNYLIEPKNNETYLVTCTPIGSTSHRIIVTGEKI